MIRTYETDYSTTVIYKIYCKDTTIKELYVGHTTDFVKRKKSHQANCNNVNTTIKLYTFIREHGGWDNWIMEVISFFNCKDLSEARQKEQEFFVSLGATLNSIEPYPRYNKENKDKNIEIESVHRETTNIGINNIISNDKKREYDNIRYACKECNVSCRKLSDWNRHLATAKHKKQTASDEKDDKVSANYTCANCEYICNKKSLWSKHILTAKHTKLSSGKFTYGYICEICNKNYSFYSSLWSHKQKCKSNTQIVPENKELRNFIIEQTKIYATNITEENKELRNFIIEQSKQHVANINEIIEKNAETLNKIVEKLQTSNIRSV